MRSAPDAKIIVIETTEQRAVFGEVTEKEDSYAISLFVREGSPPEVRSLVERCYGGDGVSWRFPFTIDGDRLRWPVLTEELDAPYTEDVSLFELGLTERDPQPSEGGPPRVRSWLRLARVRPDHAGGTADP